MKFIHVGMRVELAVYAPSSPLKAGVITWIPPNEYVREVRVKWDHGPTYMVPVTWLRAEGV